MHRRSLLKAGVAGASSFAFTGNSAAHEGHGGGEAAEDGGFEPLDSLSLPGAKELVVDDGVAYVATTDGFATVDVSDPTDLTVLAERDGLLADHPDGPLEGIYDGKVGGEYYAIGGPPNGRSDVPYAAVVFDVSDPAAPEHVLTYETDFYHHNLATNGETLYLCGNDGEGNPLVCVDIESGEEVGRWSILDADDRWDDVYWKMYELHDVWVEGGVAYLSYWDAGTWLVDVSDPSDPTPIVDLRGQDPAERARLSDSEALERRLYLPGNDHFAMPQRGVDSDLVALNQEAWGEEGDAPTSDLGGVELWNAADEERLARIEAPETSDARFRGGVWTTSHNFAFVGDRLYTSWYRGGLKVHDVSDPTDPEELAHWRDADSTSFWTAQQAGDAVIGCSWQDHTLDSPAEGAGLYALPDPGGPLDSSGTAGETDGVGAGLGAATGLFGLGVAGLYRWLRD
ncbi:LVIVD repeat-containing protein [Natronomonas amylolytica]|uniref:LVIVD repeat-containing protein n=1 Tax=Natronomonas amylolytica TaxID=3108498 RepID=UPI00300ACE6F